MCTGLLSLFSSSMHGAFIDGSVEAEARALDKVAR